MKYRTEVVREGELLGPVDWEYNFRQHFDSYCCNDDRKSEFCKRAVDLLRRVESEVDSGIQIYVCHSYIWRDVLAVGMYDGWPFWKPTPAMLCSGTLGSEWHFFYDLQEVRKRP